MEPSDYRAHQTRLSSPRRRGSSTPRLLGSITAVSGILDHPPRARVMTTEYDSRSRGMICPRFASSLPSSNSEGAGKTGCLLHPRSRVRFALTRLHTSIQVQRGIPAFPAQWLYGLLRALPGERLFCLRRPRETFASFGLDASTATPGPHDFTVRIRRARLSRPQRPPHPTARRDVRERPSSAEDARSYAADLGGYESGIFLICGVDMISENQKFDCLPALTAS